ncbi:MAG TPA: hypothetical protein VHY22_02680 [Chthoniobacteraceae bacterium]|nr:hypothetical protein [Chthoniobacteraceae bacterium]
MAPQNEYLSSGTLETLDLEIPVDNFSASTSSNDITSIECDDPRCNSYCMSGNIGNNGVATPPGLDWYIHPPGTNNFPPKDGVATTKTRSTPYCSVGGAPNSLDFPPQDTDVTGKVTDASFYMPPPAGTPANANSPGNPYGAVTSVGELGYVCTGIQTNYLASNGLVNPPPVPWRSFSLQPNSAGPNVVPDWALMDLFTTPTLISGSANIVYQPHTSDAAVGGRINVNSQMTPFSTTRFRPLAALLQGADTSISGTLAINPLTSGSAASIASNIYNKTLAKKGTLYNYPGAYISQGEICEIAGVSDQGEQSEELVRQIASLTTARTGVFSIYAVGQALKQAPSGLLSVTAEQRTQTTVEQISVTTGSIPTVDFRPVYFRALTP